MVSAERIEITLTGGAPWGFRMTGGGSLPLTINKIRKKSQAHVQGLKEGDAVISINGVHVHDKTQDEALELVEQAGDVLKLEIFRGDIDDLSREKPKKPIHVPSSDNAEGGGVILIPTIIDDSAGASADTSSGLILTVDNVTSDSIDTAETNFGHGGLRLTATVGDVSGSTYSGDTSSNLILNASVDDMSSSSNPIVLESSPVISASALSPVMAVPFVDAQATAPNPPRGSPHVPTFSPKPTSLSPQAPQAYSPQAPQAYSPRSPQGPQPYSSQPPPSFSPQPPQSRSPVPPPVSPKPILRPRPQPVPVGPKPPGPTSSVAIFDDGQTRREVKREHLVERSDDGLTTRTVDREITKTSTFTGPSFVKNEASAFNVVQPNSATETQKSSNTSKYKTTTIIEQKGPKPFTSTSPNVPESLSFQPAGISGSRSAGSLSSSGPIFKPTKFVPNSGGSKKDIPGLYTPTSPLVDVSVHAMYKDGKENVAPQPMFQVKNIVSDKAKTRAGDMWRPNVWLPDQQPPASTYGEPSVVSQKDDFSPYSSFPVPKIKPGYSLVEEQKRKLLESQTSRNEYEDFCNRQESRDGTVHHKDGRLHVFAPPVEIHADSGYPESPHDDHYYLDEDEDLALLSPDSLHRRKKNLYSDSAFYDTPGKSYPTIPEQMKLCKKIAQSLTSAANRRARGARMFMKRKHKSSQWIHEAHSEFSSSAGDVANIHELDSELSPDEGKDKPLLYFKIPDLKRRVTKEGKSTKMALSQEEFEKLRLNAKKCDHKAVPPNACFDIVADLKAHKGRGGRMFERRKERSDKFVIDETNARFPAPRAKLENVLSQPVRQEKTPWEAAMQDGGNVDAAFSHISEWERNQKLNQILKYSPPRKLQTTPLPPSVQAAPLPSVRSSLKSDESPHLLKGKNFNRTARGWGGGGEYPVAESLHHVSPTRQLGPQQNYNNKIKAWQSPGESPYVSSPAQQQSPQQDQWDPRQQGDWRGSTRAEYGQPESYHGQPESYGSGRYHEYQSPRPKSWQSDNHDAISYREELDYNYAPVDYRYQSNTYPKLAYRQPIIPGTDL